MGLQTSPSIWLPAIVTIPLYLIELILNIKDAQVDQESTYKGIFDNITTQKETIIKIKNNGWIESLCFNLDGSLFAYTGKL